MTNQAKGATLHPICDDDVVPSSSPVFADLDLSPSLQSALRDRGYAAPTPIQAQAIPHLLEGRDLLGVAQTGTGKTAAFALPIIDNLRKRRARYETCRPKVLVLTPTRELASQINDSFKAYAKGSPLRSTVVFGGVGKMPQIRAMRSGVHVLVATPGRLLDLMGQRVVDLSHVQVFVLDEADRMLDMGFLRDVRRIVDALPRKRQSLLFSATMPNDIVHLAQKLLRNPVRVEITPPSSTVERIEQRVCHVEKHEKRMLLTRILRAPDIKRALVFTRTKHGADRVVRHLASRGIDAAALHGNKSQGARERALEAFRAGRVRALVATDIAARGLDVPGITHVINFDLPNLPEAYVHRIGRTARAGRDGIAISFCDRTERAYLAAIEREIRLRLDVVGEAPRDAGLPPPPRDRSPRGPRSGGRRRTHRRGRSRR